jgi:hypothetical protein
VAIKLRYAEKRRVFIPMQKPHVDIISKNIGCGLVGQQTRMDKCQRMHASYFVARAL